MPKTFIVFTRESTEDQVEFDRYTGSVGASFDGRSVTFLATYGPHRVLEGPTVEGVVILEFPDREAAEGWYFSPAYQRAAQHRYWRHLPQRPRRRTGRVGVVRTCQ